MNNPILISALSAALFASLAACGGGDATSNNSIGNSTSTTWQFTQGKITTTDQPLDLAILGAGFFQLYNGTTPPIYTRRGRFIIDAEGYIRDQSRLLLLMRKVDVSGKVQPGPAVPLQLPLGLLGPASTTMINLKMNLDARTAVTFPGSGMSINFADSSTYNSSTSVTVYDARGQRVDLALYFQKAAANTWNLYATANGLTVAGAGLAPVAIASLTFRESGVALTQPTAPVLFDIPVTTNVEGVATLAMTGVQLDLGEATEFGSTFGVSLIKQNGSTPGALTAVYFESNGMLMGAYSNGRTIPVGQIELATFSNMLCLQSGDDNLWFASRNCGQPLTGTPGSGFFNLLVTGALEGV